MMVKKYISSLLANSDGSSGVGHQGLALFPATPTYTRWRWDLASAPPQPSVWPLGLGKGAKAHRQGWWPRHQNAKPVPGGSPGIVLRWGTRTPPKRNIFKKKKYICHAGILAPTNIWKWELMKKDPPCKGVPIQPCLWPCKGLDFLPPDLWDPAARPCPEGLV